MDNQQSQNDFAFRVFQNHKDEWVEFNKLNQENIQLICAKHIGKQELYFKCFDCSQNNSNHCYCQNCFFKDDHLGHRTQFINNKSGGVCDCADIDLNYPIFCRNHKPHNSNYLKIDEQSIIPSNIRLRIIDFISNSFRQIFQAIERKEEDNAKINKEITETLNTMFYLINAKYVVTLLVAKILMEQFKDFKTQHQCTAQVLDSNQLLNLQPHLCSCSKLNSIFRYVEAYSDENEFQFVNIIIQLFKDEHFKSITVYEFCQHFLTLFERSINRSNRPKRLIGLFYQFFCQKHLQIMLKSLHQRQIVKQLFQSLEKEIYESLKKQSNDVFSMIINVYGFILKKSDIKNIWMEDFQVILDFIAGVSRYKAIIFDNEEIIMNYFYYFNYQSSQLLKKALLIIYNLNKFEHFNLQAKQMCITLLENQEKDIDFNQVKTQRLNIQPPHYNDIRQFTFLLINLLLCNNQSVQIVRQTVSSWIGEQEFDQQILQMIYRGKHFIRYVIFNQNKSKCTKKQIKNYSQECQEMFEQYMLPQQSLYDYDFCSLQVALMFLQEQQIFDVFLFNPEDSELEQQDYLSFLPQLILNEISFINIANQIVNIFEHGYLQNAVKNLVINCFFGEPVQSLEKIKEKLNMIGLNSDIEIQEILLEISFLDEENSCFRVKEQYKNLYDPYYFSRSLRAFSQFYDNLKKVYSKEKHLDIIFGNIISLNHLPSQQQQKITSDQIQTDNNSSNISKNNNDNKFKLLNVIVQKLNKSENFIKRLCLQIYQTVNRDALKIMQIIIYQSADNINLIDTIIKCNNDIEAQFANDTENSTLEKELSFNLQKYKEILRHLQEFQQAELDHQQQQQKCSCRDEINKQNLIDSSLDNRKQQIEQRQLVILQQFQQKQQQFQQKLLQQIQQINEQEIQEEQANSASCIICRIQQNDFILIPCFISQDNSSGVKKNIISSCKHFVHQRCFEKQHYGLNIDQVLDSYCSQCKFLTNLCLTNYEHIFQQSIANKKLMNLVVIDSLKLMDQITKEKISGQSFQSCLFQGNDQEKYCQIQTQIQIFMTVLAINTDNETNQDPDWMFKIMRDLFEFLAENAFQFGLAQFIKSDYFIFRNLLLTLHMLYSQKIIPSNFFLEGCQQNIDQAIQDLNNIFQYASKNVQVNGDQNSRIYKLFIQFVINTLLSLKNEELIQVQIYQSFISFFFDQLLVYFSFIESQIHSTQAFTMENIINQLQSNSDFVHQILSQMLPYLRLTGCVYICIKQQDLNTLEQIGSQPNFTSDEEEIQFYCQLLSNQQLFDLNQRVKRTNVLQTLELLQDSQVQQKINLQQLQMSIPKLTCRKQLIQLFPTFAETHKAYFFNYCYLCNYYPQIPSSELYLCLICGRNLCGGNCKNSQIKNNLNYHTNNYHCGVGIFYQIQNGMYIIIFKEITVFQYSIYKDKYGQYFQAKSQLQFEGYKLDQQNWGKINDYYNKRRIPQLVRYLLINGFKNWGANI